MIRFFVDETALQQAMAGLPMLALLVVIVVAIGILSKGADWMIDGVVQLAQRTKIPSVVIGATIVSLGTTMPEAFVSVLAAFMGNPGLALGNGVGSIIADSGLIFGLTCLLAPVAINRFILNRIGWVLVGSATLLVIISFVSKSVYVGTPYIPRFVGVFFLILLACYMYFTYRFAKQRQPVYEDDNAAIEREELSSLWMCWLMLIGGLIMVIVGARTLIPAASEVAIRFGIAEDIIAATLVAFGTSLPELMTAITAIRKGHPDIVVGNIIGADILNCLFVIGAAATARSLAIPSNFFYFHFPTMLIILYTMRLFIAFNRHGRFYRWQGGILLAIYLIYVGIQYTVMNSV